VSGKNKKESIWIKIYLISLFICGIAIWFALQYENSHRTSIDVILDKKIVEILVSHRVKQEDILKQFTREKTENAIQRNGFYKKIKLKKATKIKDFEKSFRSLARSMKIGLSRIDNSDGSITYKFYSPSRTYSTITFLREKGRKEI
jgi:hypothetical protein